VYGVACFFVLLVLFAAVSLGVVVVPWCVKAQDAKMQRREDAGCRMQDATAVVLGTRTQLLLCFCLYIAVLVRVFPRYSGVLVVTLLALSFSRFLVLWSGATALYFLLSSP